MLQERDPFIIATKPLHHLEINLVKMLKTYTENNNNETK